MPTRHAAFLYAPMPPAYGAQATFTERRIRLCATAHTASSDKVIPLCKRCISLQLLHRPNEFIPKLPSLCSISMDLFVCVGKRIQIIHSFSNTGVIKMTQHISIRVPWKDNGYSGRVCEKPCFNTSCTKLKIISKDKNDSLEERLAGQCIKGNEKCIPCLAEGGCFMSQDTYIRQETHPYKKTVPIHTVIFYQLI